MCSTAPNRLKPPDSERMPDSMLALFQSGSASSNSQSTELHKSCNSSRIAQHHLPAVSTSPESNLPGLATDGARATEDC